MSLSPRSRDGRECLIDVVDVYTVRIVIATPILRHAPKQNEGLHFFRVTRGEEHAQRTALGETKYGRTLRMSRFHNGAQVIDAFLQRGRTVDTVGHALTALVEHDDAKVLAKLGQKRPQSLVIPTQLEVGNHPRDVQKITLAVPKHLVSNA